MREGEKSRDKLLFCRNDCSVSGLCLHSRRPGVKWPVVILADTVILRKRMGMRHICCLKMYAEESGFYSTDGISVIQNGLQQTVYYRENTWKKCISFTSKGIYDRLTKGMKSIYSTKNGFYSGRC